MKHITKLTALLLALVLCLSLLPMSALAAEKSEQEPTVIDSGSCGENLTWRLTDDGVLTVSGSGKMTSHPWDAYKSEIKKAVFEKGITSIPSNSFFDCTALTDVTFPEGLKKIDSHAFEGCTALREINLPSSLKSLRSGAFWKCSSLTSVYLPPNTTYMEARVFYECTGLKNAVLAGNYKYLPSLFVGCSSLTDVTFLGTIEGYMYYSFARCTSLKEVVIPEGCKQIQRTFYNCTSLERVVIPASVEEIVCDPFYNCTALKEVCYLGTPEQWAKIKISEEGTYHLLRAASYNLPLCNISTKYTNYTYTGKAIKPTVTVKTLNDVKLKEGKNYTVSYKNNTDYGTGTITITGIGKYSGTKTLTFQIRPAKVQDLKMDRKTTYADLTWTANPDATSYRIYKSGVLQGETTDTHYHLTGLTAKTNRTVTVKAVVKRTYPATGESEIFESLASSVKVTPIS